MSEIDHVVDHMRLDYTGPFDAHELYRLATSYWREKGFDLHALKDYEHHLVNGVNIEWELKPWKQISHDTRQLIRMRFLIYNYKKTDTVIGNKKTKVGSGRIEVYLDAFIAFDQWNIWDSKPVFQFLRTLYIKFIYKIYTDRFEQRLNYDMHQFYDTLEKFFNVYKHYRVVSKVAPFVSH